MTVKKMWHKIIILIEWTIISHSSTISGSMLGPPKLLQVWSSMIREQEWGKMGTQLWLPWIRNVVNWSLLRQWYICYPFIISIMPVRTHQIDQLVDGGGAILVISQREGNCKWKTPHYVIYELLLLYFVQIWDTTEFCPRWDSNSQPSDLWANT